MLLEIKTFPNPILKKIAEEVKVITPELVQLSKDMIETMYAKSGVGLAAPQIGKSIRLIVMDCSDERNKPVVFFNPVVKDGLGKMVDTEGCLSVPGVEAKVQRFAEIIMTGQNEKGEQVAIPACELYCRCFQHEIDHLNGVLFIDKLSPLQKFKVRKLIQDLEANPV
jgi:peptide deformylase